MAGELLETQLARRMLPCGRGNRSESVGADADESNVGNARGASWLLAEIDFCDASSLLLQGHQNDRYFGKSLG